MSKDEQLHQDNPADDPASAAADTQEAAPVQPAADPEVSPVLDAVQEAAPSPVASTTSDASASAAATQPAEPATEPTAEQADASEPALPPHFTPIPEEKLARAKRIKRILIVIIVLLLAILLGTAGTALYYYVTYAQVEGSITQPDGVIGPEDDIQDRGTMETIAMPRLTQMFGKTPEAVLTLLGPGYSITKTDTVSEEGTSASEPSAPEDTPADSPADSTEEPATDETGSAIAQVVTISYTSAEQASPVGATQVQNIYLSLDEAGQTVEVYFTSSMNLLDFPISSFADLVATKNSFVATLSSVGATVASDVAYPTLTKEEYTTYVDPEASNKKIRKETREWSGALVAEQPPTNFEISYTYDYGASGAEDTPDRQPSQRMLHIKLS
ncbi:MAG: hypothetical protein LBJ48_05685 [Coriobacteriales bacterium]|nr:hypothetical protein [Coriobacteriales bacterium]